MLIMLDLTSRFLNNDFVLCHFLGTGYHNHVLTDEHGLCAYQTTAMLEPGKTLILIYEGGTCSTSNLVNTCVDDMIKELGL